jgi:iron-sulfur cluster assembly accessory protein
MFVRLTSRFRCLQTIASRLIKDKYGQEMSVELTESAVKKLKELENTEIGKKLRVAVDSGGCHGLSYSFSLDDIKDNEDIVFKEAQSGASIIIDTFSLPYVAGCTVDYEQTFMRSAFVIKHNPQASSECGCGTSFDIDKNKTR